MYLTYTLLLVIGYPWFRDGIDAFRCWRTARRECKYLDLEYEFEF